MIIGCDAHAHYEPWGRININNRRTTLLEYIMTTQMDIVNQRNEPNFITASRREVLDLTLVLMKKIIDDIQ